ncbi:PCRF domain-containing protein, partial [Faecalibacterium duncaniae]
MSRLLSQMEAVSHRFEELSIRLNQPETAADPALLRRLMQEYHEAEPVVQAYQALTTAQDHLAQAKALLEGETLDPDFKEMVQQEIGEKSQEVAQLENNLKILLLPKDVNDDKSVIMELRGGAGGEEAALFAHSLMRMYTMYVQSRGWELEVLNLNETELGGVKEAILAVNGTGAYNRLKYESGVHRVQRVPETETQGRIHTSTATVAVMPQAEEVDLVIDPKDLRIDTFRSSGAGGQHIN